MLMWFDFVLKMLSKHFGDAEDVTRWMQYLKLIYRYFALYRIFLLAIEIQEWELYKNKSHLDEKWPFLQVILGNE